MGFLSFGKSSGGGSSFGDMFSNQFGEGSSNFNPFSSATSGVGTTSTKKNAWSFLSQSGLGGSINGMIPDTGSFEANQLLGGGKEALNKVLSGDLVGGAMAIVNTIGGLFNKDKYRDNITKERLGKLWKTFSSSAKDLDAINVLFKDAMMNYIFEKSKDGDYQNRFPESLIPIETAMLSDNFSFVTKTAKNSKGSVYSYKVWSEPTAVAQVTGTISNIASSGGGKALLGVGALALIGFMMKPKAKRGKKKKKK